MHYENSVLLHIFWIPYKSKSILVHAEMSLVLKGSQALEIFLQAKFVLWILIVSYIKHDFKKINWRTILMSTVSKRITVLILAGSETEVNLLILKSAFKTNFQNASYRNITHIFRNQNL